MNCSRTKQTRRKEMQMEKRTDMRAEALDTLIDIERNKKLSHIAIGETLMRNQFEKKADRAFYTRLCEGVTERKIYLDYILDHYSKTPMKKCKPLIRSLLRMGAYQILFMDVRDAAACSEAVSLAKKRGFGRLSGFVNGVLRNIARTKTQIAYPDETDPVKCYSVRYSMPEWLVTLFLEERGAEITKQIFEEMQKVHPVVLRYCGPEEKKEDWKQSVAAQQITLRQHPYLSYAYLIEGGESVQSIPGYEEGLFTVQDVSSMLVTEAAGLLGDELLLDVCAAPGGKSLHAAGLLKEENVISRDLTDSKTALIEENSRRCNCPNIRIETFDALEPDENMIGKADVVYADLPCSGLGILGKKRDIRYRMNPEQMKALVELQQKIMSVIWQYVKPGGTLMYSTCTIHRAENEQMVQWFTQNFPFERQSMKEHLPEDLWDSEENGMLQLLPGIHQTDGFFVAKLRRVEKKE